MRDPFLLRGLCAAFCVCHAAWSAQPHIADALPKPTKPPVPSVQPPGQGTNRLFQKTGNVQFSPPRAINAPKLVTTIDALNFDSESALSGFYHIPPDPCGAVGPDHVVSVVNTSIWWATKLGANVSAQSLDDFFAPLNAVTGELFDPKVIYDQYAGRFVVVVLEQQDTSSGGPANTSRILVAVSDDADPNGTWRFNAINSRINIGGTNHWADYPGLAVDDEAIYITNNMFTFGTTRTYGGARLWIVNKTPFYAGGSASVTVHDPSGAVGQNPTTMMPAHTFGAVPGAIGTWLLRYSGFTDGTNESLSVIRVDNPLSTPTFSHAFVGVGNIDNTAASIPGAPQPGTSTTIDAGDRRMLHAVWRNNALYAVATVRPPSGPDTGQATTHWFKVDSSTLLLLDQGNAGGEDIQTGAHTYWGSIAVNNEGVIGVGFALSGSTTFAGAYYAMHFPTDSPGVMSSTGFMVQGVASYIRTFGTGRNRWGDYSSMSIDPADGSSFWQFHEYAMAQGTPFQGENGRWATRFGKISVGPTVVMTSSAPDPTNTSPIPVTATFSDPVSNFDGGDVVVSNATLSGFAAISASVYKFNLTPLAQGIVTADIPANVAVDASDTGNQAAVQFVRTFDSIPPGIAIGAPSSSATNTGPVTFPITYTGADSVTLATANVTLNKAGTANGTVFVLGSGTAARTVVVSSITGNGTLGISITPGTASDFAGNTAPAAGPSATFTVDNTPPTLSIGAPSSSVTTTGPVSYSVSYTGATTVSLSPADVTLNTSGTATGSIAVTGSGTSGRTITISSITGDGTIGISIAAGTASDGVGNLAPAAGPSGTFTVDNSGPAITIGAPTPAITRTFPISFVVSYSGASSVSLTPGDVTLNTTGTATGNIAVAGSGVVSRTVTINSVSGDGTLGISIAAGTALDALGNASPAAGPSAVATVDNTPPSISISAPSTNVTGSGPVSYTITYGGASAVSLNTGSVTLNATGTATGAVSVSGSGTTTRTVAISSISGDGTLGISIAAGTASDAAGNAAPAAGPSATFIVDSTPITIGIGTPSAAITRNGPVDFTVSYENVQTVTLAPADITLNRTGTANGTVAVSGAKVDGPATRTVTISGITGDGMLGISIAAGTASDTAGITAPAAGPGATFIVDNTPPGISIGPPSIFLTDVGPVSFTVTYASASSVTLTPANVTVHAAGTAAAGTVTVTGTGASSRTVTLDNISGDGLLGISIAPGTASDSAGNLAPAAGPSENVTIVANLASLPMGTLPVFVAMVLAIILMFIARRNGRSRS